MNEARGKLKARNYYDQEAEDYIKQYGGTYKEYPANLIRLNFIIKRLRLKKVKTVLDVGCGTCGPMIRLLKEGFDVTGFDFSKKMLEQGKENLARAGYDPEIIQAGDVEGKWAPSTKHFDAVLALGVFPHILNEKIALRNIKNRLARKGSVFVEFRNDLFSAYTLNNYSLDFFLKRVVDVNRFPKKIQQDVKNFYLKRLLVNKPLKGKTKKLQYEDVLAKFHNPLTIAKDLFLPCHYSVLDIHFYHYHVLPPIFQEKYPEMFYKLSFELEKPNDWKGYLIASAFVVEAEGAAGH